MTTYKRSNFVKQDAGGSNEMRGWRSVRSFSFEAFVNRLKISLGKGSHKFKIGISCNFIDPTRSGMHSPQTHWAFPNRRQLIASPGNEKYFPLNKHDKLSASSPSRKVFLKT
jgi:hypothetical protein